MANKEVNIVAGGLYLLREAERLGVKVGRVGATVMVEAPRWLRVAAQTILDNGIAVLHAMDYREHDPGPMPLGSGWWMSRCGDKRLVSNGRLYYWIAELNFGGYTQEAN